MATQLRIKRGTTNANAPSGLTAGEMAINLVDKKLYVGGTAGTNVIFLDSTSSVGLSTANTFTALQTFSAGISASGATFSGNISAPNIVTVGTANTFTALQTFSVGISASGATFSGPIQIPINTAPAITIGNDATRNLTLSSITREGEIVQSGAANASLNIRQESGGVVSIGDFAETNNSTYIEVNDDASLIALSAGDIQINGTISTPLVLANAESIQNTTNGRIDFMPGPTAAGAYGLYADVANWGYGVKMGTINSAGTIDSSPGGILFMDRVTFHQDKFIGLASDGTHGLICTTQGLNTLQIGVYPGVANSNAVAIVGTDFTGTTNRSPVTSHTNPNLYIYRAGATSANDFIRIEHDGTNGNIVAGGTSGIKISGLLDVASGLSAAGATFSATTASTSSITGAVIIAGGVGIAKDSYINGHRIGQGLLASQQNLAVGAFTLASTVAGGIDNTAVGYYAGNSITTGVSNVMLGAYAGQSNTSGQSNMCIGEGAHYSNQTGSYYVAFGGGAGHQQNNGSVYNVFLGSNAGYFITSGNQTTCVGGDAGRRQADGTTNMTASSDSVYIGYNAKGFNNSDSNTIVIGANAIGLGANKTAIGTTFTTETKLFGLLNLPSGLSASGATLSGTVITSEKVNAITSARTVTVNFQNGNIQTLTGLGSGATGSSAIGFTGASATGSSTVTMIITNGGLMTSNTTFWSTAVKWPGGFKTTLSTSGVDILTFTTIDAGTNIYGMLGGKAFS